MASANRAQSELNWSPKLKSGRRRNGGDLSGSAQAASKAMGHIKDIELRKQSGQDIDDSYLEKVSQTLSSKAAKRGPAPVAQTRGVLPKGWPIAIGLLVAGCCGYCALSIIGSRVHSVSGTLLLTRKPIAGAAVVFHPTRSGGEPARTTTAPDGSFRIDGLSSDAYKVTVEPGDGGTAFIPPAYRNATTTPFTLNVYKDLEKLRMYALNTPPRKAAVSAVD
ncbi:MAG: carboxypeptidase-like regulatory domain-containing protein [Planctomycetia bacterium]|nr:carboxypeptidase-like regulatory domain-containing protein [Planctomycetia bacterium]